MCEKLGPPTIAEFRKAGEPLPMAMILRLFTAGLPERYAPPEEIKAPREQLDPTKIVIPGI